MIDALNHAQHRAITACRDYWLREARSTEPADRPRAEAAIEEIYARINLAPPAIVWETSPLHALIDAHAAGAAAGRYLKPEISLPGSWLEGNERQNGPFADLVSADVMARLHTTLVHPLWRLRPVLSEPWLTRARRPVGIMTSLRMAHSLTGMIENLIAEALRRAEVNRSYTRTLRNSVMFGAGAPCLVALYQFLREHCGLMAATEIAVPHIALAQSAGWVLPRERICWVCERPTVLHLGPDGQLHNADGPALQYGDALEFYVWRGREVPRSFVREPETIRASDVLAEADADIRNVMLERMGLGRFIRESGAELVHSDETGRLWRKRLGGNRRAMFDPSRMPVDLMVLEVENGTPRPDGTRETFYLRVPPEMRTARAAVAWTYGLSPNQYDLVVRT